MTLLFYDRIYSLDECGHDLRVNIVLSSQVSINQPEPLFWVVCFVELKIMSGPLNSLPVPSDQVKSSDGGRSQTKMANCNKKSFVHVVEDKHENNRPNTML